MEARLGGGHESLHADSIAVPDTFFIDPKKAVDLIDEAMCEYFKPDRADRAWFRNPDLSEHKLTKRTKPFAAMLATIFMNDQRWIDLVQSHFDNLVDDGRESPIVTKTMMTEYFENIEGMRTVAFSLVCGPLSHTHGAYLMQLKPAFAYSRRKKGDSFRKRKEREVVKQVRMTFHTHLPGFILI